MSERAYTLSDGVFRFAVSETVELRLQNVNKDRHGRLYADARFLTVEGGLLGQDIGELTSGAWRQRLCLQVAARNSGDTLPYENAVMAAVVALERDPAVGSKDGVVSRANLMPVSEYLRQTPPPKPYLVAGLFEMGTLDAVCAKPKVAKSLLTLGLAVTVASGGGSWLGRTVQAGRVAVFQLEDSPRTISRRLEAMMAGRPAPDLFIHRSQDPFKLTSENYDDTLAKCRGCSLVILDPIVQATNVQDWNSAFEVRAAWDLWRRLARDLDCVVLIVAHHRKALGEFGDQMGGSIQGVAAPDGLLEIRRDGNLEKNQRKLSFLGRDWPDMDDEVIELDGLTLTFKVVGTASEVAEAHRKETHEANAWRLSQMLPNEPPGLRPEDITEKSGIPTRTVRGYLRYLEANHPKNLRSTGTKQSKKDPARYWWRPDGIDA
jgi:hypothetical protein